MKPPVWTTQTTATVVLGGAAALALVLPGLGSFGLWTPHEADLAARAAGVLHLPEPIGPPEPRWAPLLLAISGLSWFAASEGGARLPGAIVALLNLLAVAWAGTRLGTRRGGLLAALVLASFPLFVLQARQLTSDLPASLGFALALGGLGQVVRARTGRRAWAGVALAALGIAGTTLLAGVLGGALPLLLGFVAAFWLADRDGNARLPGYLAWTALALAALLAAPLLLAQPAGVSSPWLGGVPLGRPSPATFERLLECLGFGMFPLGALAAFALAQPLALSGRRADFAPLLLLFTAGFALAASTLQLHLLGQGQTALLPALALALAAWLDQQWPAAQHTTAASPAVIPSPAPAGNPLLAFVMAAAALLLARDLTLVPEALVSSHLPTRIVWPAGLSLKTLALAAGGCCALGLALLLGFAPTRPRRVALALALVLLPPLGLAFALAHHVVPALSRHLSSKALLDSYRQQAAPGTPLALYRTDGSEIGVFNRPPSIVLRDLEDLLGRWRTRADLFALVPRPQLAALEARLGEGKQPFVVTDASSSRHLLLTAQLPPGVTDHNPLRAFVWHSTGGQARPAWATPNLASASSFGAAIELVGAEFPAVARRGKGLPLTLIFRVLAQPGPGQKIFVHLERPGQPLLNGDHAPVGGIFATEHWRAGDFIRDQTTVELPRVTTAAGQYRLLVGFWPGGDTPRRLPITAGAQDGNDRAALGVVVIE